MDIDLQCVRAYCPRMDNVTLIGALVAMFLGAIVLFFVLFVAIWSVNRHGRRRSYLLRVGPKYSISPLFGQPRSTLLREVQKPSI